MGLPYAEGLGKERWRGAVLTTGSALFPAAATASFQSFRSYILAQGGQLVLQDHGVTVLYCVCQLKRSLSSTEQIKHDRRNMSGEGGSPYGSGGQAFPDPSSVLWEGLFLGEGCCPEERSQRGVRGCCCYPSIWPPPTISFCGSILYVQNWRKWPMTINSLVYQNMEAWQSSGHWSVTDQDSGYQGTLVWPDVWPV